MTESRLSSLFQKVHSSQVGSAIIAVETIHSTYNNSTDEVISDFLKKTFLNLAVPMFECVLFG